MTGLIPATTIAYEREAMPASRQWYVVQTKPRQEFRAEANLARGGIETFLPRARSLTRVRVHRQWHVEALFPGYVFVHCNLLASAHNIRYTRGALRIVGNLNGALPVDDTIVALIRERLNDAGVVELVPVLSPGDRVRITDGPLKDFLGVFEASTNSAGRIRLLLSTISGQCRIVVPDSLVEKV